MSRINILDESVYNKIAAGEVVEKPASIVKELVENSIDAGATDILIEIENGGIDKIRIVDNGCGIHPDDVKPAFITHATSKIKNVEDLNEIATLGFRGEALSSIASVTKLKMQTKQKEFQEGKQIEIWGGIVKDFCDFPMNDGTIVEIEDLFYNIPARKKFLRKPKTEESEITNLVSRYILANPKIKFSYVQDGTLIYKTSGTSLENAIYEIYKKDTLNNLIKVDYCVDDIKIYGYISKPTFTKSNRTYQTLIINNRYVVNSLISTCVQNAYENLIMKGQFPMFVLNFELPLNSVDVNVHPNKLDVKFENTQKIYGYFYTAISKALNNNSFVKKVSVFESALPKAENKIENNFVGKSYNDTLNNQIEKSNNEQNLSKNEEIINNFSKNQQQIAQKISTMLGEENKFCENEIMTKILNKQVEREMNNQYSSNLCEVNLTNNQTFDDKIKNSEQTIFSTKQQVFENIDKLNYKIIGCAFETYILLEINGSIFVFDQHACHERLNYDKLINQINNKALSVQPLLVPYIFETNEIETNFLEEKLSSINDLGFEICLFGQNCFKVSSVPSILAEINLKNFFEDILKDLGNLKKLTTEKLLKEKLSQKACKASIKAGYKLKNDEIDLLLSIMQKSNMTLSCPHGRPAVIEITKSELEKWFKRKL